jgi:hypothetical protein
VLKSLADKWRNIVVLSSAAVFLSVFSLQLLTIGAAVQGLPQFQVTTQERLDSYDRILAVIRNDLSQIQSDKPIVQISRFSGVVEGACSGQPGEPCTFEVIARRVAGREMCEFLRVEDFVASSTDLRPVPVKRLEGPNVNIGLEWTPLFITIELPPRLEAGEADFFFAAFYANCPEGGEASQIIEPIAFQVAEEP